MKRLLQVAAATALAFSALTTTAAADLQTDATEWSPLVSPQVLDLLSTTEDLQIIDIRSEKRVNGGTIPGAVWLEYGDWRGPEDRPGLPPTEERLEAFLGGAGLQADRPTVIFNHSGRTMQAGRAAFVYWVLKTAGFDEVAILDGGYKAWDRVGLEVAEAPITPTPEPMEVEFRYDWWADPVDIYGVVSGQMEGTILDARFASQVQKSAETGEPLMSIPFARYIPVGLVAENLTPERMTYDGMMDYRTSLEERGIVLDSDLLISICQTGELSALSWFYASEIVKIENVRYYPDALQGWKADGGLLFGLSTSL